MKSEYEEFYALHLDEFIKVRADMTCERCGRRQDNWHLFRHLNPQHLLYSIRGNTGYHFKVRLAVHHKDGNPENNRLSNLICLCQKCHLFAERQNRKYPQVSLLRWLALGGRRNR